MNNGLTVEDGILQNLQLIARQLQFSSVPVFCFQLDTFVYTNDDYIHPSLHGKHNLNTDIKHLQLY